MRSSQINRTDVPVAGVLVAPVVTETCAQANGVEDDKESEEDSADGDARVESRIVAVLLGIQKIYDHGGVPS